MITFKKIKDGWTDVDVIIMPAVMGKLGPLGRFRTQRFNAQP
jgi:hypothetical protein